MKWLWVAIAGIFFIDNVGTAAADDIDSRELARQAQELNDHADRLSAEGKYIEALPIAEKALAIREQIFGRSSLEAAASLDSLGVTARNYALFPKAETLLKRALEIREKILGERNADVAATLNNLGGLYYLMNEDSTAERYYIRALSIREALHDTQSPATVRVLNNLSIVYSRIGQFTRAEQLLKRALSVCEEYFPPEEYATAITLDNLGGFYVMTGAYAKAQPLVEKALAIKERTLGPTHPQTAISLLNLSRYYKLTGSYERAESLNLRALDLLRISYPPNHPIFGGASLSLGILYARTGDYTRAEAQFLRAISIHEKASKNSLLLARDLSNLAELYGQMGNYERAEELFLRALSIESSNGEIALGSMAMTLEDFGVLLFNNGQKERAESLIRRALEIREAGLMRSDADLATSLTNLGVLKWAEGQLDDALSNLQKAQRIQVKRNSDFLFSGSEARKRAYLQALATGTAEYVTFSVTAVRRGGASIGLSAVLDFKGRALDATSDNVTILRQSLRPEDRQLFDERAQVASQLSTLLYRGDGNSAPESFRKRLEGLSEEKENLDNELARRSGIFRQQVTTPTVDQIQKSIPGTATLLEWFRYVPFDPRPRGVNELEPLIRNKPRYVVYVLKHTGDPVAVDIGDAESIDALVYDFRSSINDAKRTDSKLSASALSTRILGPVYGYLQNTKQLLLSPDGALNVLPMAALLDEHGEYLARRFDISYLTSARDLLRFNANVSQSSDAIIMADPNFGAFTPIAVNARMELQAQRSADLDRGGLVFRQLASTALEAVDLGRLLKLEKSDVILGEEATETRLKHVHGPRILHIATHGFFLSDQDFSTMPIRGKYFGDELPIVLGENPLLRSGIALAGANARHSGASDDGVLTALEAAQLDLHGTELVVLSACDSGMGEIKNGEGVYGLRRALVLAGAQTQVTSLWKVSDEATRILMVDFYQRLIEGEGRSEALRHAQLDLLAKPEYSHPYYWASFIPIGNWKPLPAIH